MAQTGAVTGVMTGVATGTWHRWEDAWARALYGPAGFYRRPEGPAGHFATSAQGLAGTGVVLAEAVLALAARHELHTVIEIAAGRGELLDRLHTASGGAVRLVGVDIVPRPPGLPESVEWHTSPGGAALPEELTDLTGVLVLAHEWLDVVPCPVVARETTSQPWHHVEVDPTTGDERPGAAVEGTDLTWLTDHVPDHVQRAEVGLPRDTAYTSLCARVTDGLVVAVDYGHTRQHRPVDGTLTAYRDGVQRTPVPDGSCDLTAHVAVDTLGATSLQTQRAALHDLLGRAVPPPHSLSGTDPGAYLTALGRTSALTALTDPRGLGGFWWALTARGQVALAADRRG